MQGASQISFYSLQSTESSFRCAACSSHNQQNVEASTYHILSVHNSETGE